MHRLAISKMKIELPWRSVPPSQRRILVGTLRTRTSLYCRSMRAGFSSSVQPRSTYLMPRIGIVGVVGGVRVIHGHDVGQHRRPDIVVVVGGDAHELRALDQEGRMADIADAHLIGVRARRDETRRAPRTAAASPPGPGSFRSFPAWPPAAPRLAPRPGSPRPERRERRCNEFQRSAEHEHHPRRSGSGKSGMVCAGSPLPHAQMKTAPRRRFNRGRTGAQNSSK